MGRSEGQHKNIDLYWLVTLNSCHFRYIYDSYDSIWLGCSVKFGSIYELLNKLSSDIIFKHMLGDVSIVHVNRICFKKPVIKSNLSAASMRKQKLSCCTHIMIYKLLLLANKKKKYERPNQTIFSGSRTLLVLSRPYLCSKWIIFASQAALFLLYRFK